MMFSLTTLSFVESGIGIYLSLIVVQKLLRNYFLQVLKIFILHALVLLLSNVRKSNMSTVLVVCCVEVVLLLYYL